MWRRQRFPRPGRPETPALAPAAAGSPPRMERRAIPAMEPMEITATEAHTECGPGIRTTGCLHMFPAWVMDTAPLVGRCTAHTPSARSSYPVITRPTAPTHRDTPTPVPARRL